MPLPHMNNHDNRHSNIFRFICLIILVSLAWAAAPADADIHSWQDEKGHWHFSDSPPQDKSVEHTPGVTPTPPAPGTDNHSPQASPQTNERTQGGMLWRISRDGLAHSYLLGTIHSDDPRVTRLKPEVARALDQSDRFIMEMTLDTNAFMHFGTVMLLKDGQELETLVGNKLYAQVKKAMADSGIPEPMVRRLKPWVVIAMLSMPKSGGGLILDMVLYQRATGQGKPTSGLETAQEQLAVFDELSLEDQIDLLKMTLEQLPKQPQTFESLITAYADNDLQAIETISEQANQADNLPAAQRFMSRLNDQRNQRMAQRMVPYLEQGNSFIAIGALHLSGPNGLLSILRKQGYHTSPAW